MERAAAAAGAELSLWTMSCDRSQIMSWRLLHLRSTLVVWTVVVAACETSLQLPGAPVTVPHIERLEPRAAFGDTEIALVGTGFDPDPENNEVSFQGGFAARGLRVEEGRLYVRVPQEVQRTGPVSVVNATGLSEPSAESFVPLGYGHPIYGTDVAELRFRHRPVGVVDTANTVVVASTLLKMLLTDAGDFTEVVGTPVLFGRGGVDGAYLATRDADGGRMYEVDRPSGHIRRVSDPSGVIEQFLLRGTGELAARTIGIDAWGGVSLAEWRNEGEKLVATRKPIAVDEVLGAACDEAGDMWIVGRLVVEGEPQTQLLRLADSGVTSVWNPTQRDDEPTGPIAMAQTEAGSVAVLGLRNGDLAFVNGVSGAWHRVVMASFGAIGALATGTEPHKVVATKPVDGAVYLFDVPTAHLDWTVQIRGEPTTIDVAPDIGEIAVTNAEDNVVDIMSDTGTWLGRLSFSLGLGSADGLEGGAAMAYSYQPDLPERPFRLDLLARAVGMVLTLDPASLDLLGSIELDDDASEALRLAVTPDLHTLVVHRRELGILEPTGERLVLEGLRTTPLGLDFLPDGRVLLGTTIGVDVFDWNAEGTLDRVGGLTLAHGASLVGFAVRPRAERSEVVVWWRTAAGYGGGIYDAEALVGGGTPRMPLALDPSLGDGLGVLRLFDGPALAFGRSSLGAPAFVPWKGLETDGAPQTSAASRPLLAGVSPDRRFVTWLDEGAGDNMVRLLRYFEPSGDDWGGSLEPYSSYRLPARGAGPVFDPSGQWMYVPVPKLDMLVVVQ